MQCELELKCEACIVQFEVCSVKCKVRSVQFITAVQNVLQGKVCSTGMWPEGEQGRMRTVLKSRGKTR